MPNMYDAIYPNTIPSNVPAPNYTMGYVDGKWPTASAMAAKYPTAIPVAISAIPNSPTAHLAQGCDGEKGDYSPEQAATFAHLKLANNIVPFTYCSLSAWPTYKQALVSINVNPSLVDWGIAAQPGNGANLYPGSVFHQYIDHGSYDESVVLPNWQPGRQLASPIQSEEEMPVSPVVIFNTFQHVFQTSYGNLWHKWFDVTWHNEVVAGPLGGSAGIKITIPDQAPNTSIVNNQLIVTIEDQNRSVFYFATGTNGGWGVNQLP